ncbi:hypothetical protein Tco_0264948 [Tanacetum coccineum]
MSTRSSSSNLIPPFSDPESVIRNRQRNLGDPSLLLDFEEINMNSNNVQGPPPVDPPPQNHNGPPGLNLQMPAPDLQTMEELCKPIMNDTFYNGLTLRHRDTINVAVGGTFMKRQPEECYDLIENMTAHHNDWDTSAHRGESSTTSYSSEIAALAQQMVEMRKDMIQMFCSNQKVNSVTPSWNYNPGGNAYQPQGDRNLLSYRSNIFLGPPGFNPPPNNQNQARPSVPPPPLSSSSKEVERDPETITDQVLTESTTRVLPLVVSRLPLLDISEIPLSPYSSPSKLPKWNPHQPLIPYPLRLNTEKLQDKSDIQVHKFLQMFKKHHFNISLAEALALMPKYAKMLKDLLSDKEKLLGLANTSLTENCSVVLLKKLHDALIYLSPPGDDDDDFFDFKSDNEEWKKLLYGDHFNDIHSGKDKIKDFKIKTLINELESPESNVLLP